MVRIHDLERFRMLLQGGTLGGSEWILPNQLGKVVYLQDTWVFVAFKAVFFRQVWIVVFNTARTAMFMYGGLRDRDFVILHRFWIHVHHHRVGGVTTSASWVVLGVDLGNPSIEDILRCGFPRTLNTIWFSASNLKASGLNPPKRSLSKVRVIYNKYIILSGEILHFEYPPCEIMGLSIFFRYQFFKDEYFFKRVRVLLLSDIPRYIQYKKLFQ